MTNTTTILTSVDVQGLKVSEKYRDKPRDSEIEKRLQTLCPRVLAYYR